MLELIQDLLLRGALSKQGSRTVLFGRSVLFTPSELLARMVNAVHESPVPSLLYETARVEGFEWFKDMIKQSKVRNEDEIVKMGVDILTFGGWGSLNIDEFAYGNKLGLVRINDSVFVKDYLNLFGPSKHAVDDVIRGLMAGGAAITRRDSNFEIIEKECIARGGTQCLLVGKSRDEFDLSNEDVLFQIGGKKMPLDLSFLKGSG